MPDDITLGELRPRAANQSRQTLLCTSLSSSNHALALLLSHCITHKYLSMYLIGDGACAGGTRVSSAWGPAPARGRAARADARTSPLSMRDTRMDDDGSLSACYVAVLVKPYLSRDE
ncbi:hypothetical protein EVAR_53799_1 [Eumeta japonica]|uniref:Uncharacterized protein n=1 Tax=Eumeta variegata TaxID=151549 RepID=A0A4C1XXG0_EUMVA|nr:hypothetical protein EVAR_53799_1 [Eumeta japonica]